MNDGAAAAPNAAATDSTTRALRRLAGALALAVAAIHAHWAFSGLATHLRAGIVHDPRPLLFVASAIAVALGVARVLDGANRRPVYLGGIALMGTFLLGYAAWHTILDHGSFWPYIPSHGHAEGGPVEIVARHLLLDARALVSKTLELATLVLLAVLYRREFATPDG